MLDFPRFRAALLSAHRSDCSLAPGRYRRVGLLATRAAAFEDEMAATVLSMPSCLSTMRARHDAAHYIFHRCMRASRYHAASHTRSQEPRVFKSMAPLACYFALARHRVTYYSFVLLPSPSAIATSPMAILARAAHAVYFQLPLRIY